MTSSRKSEFRVCPKIKEEQMGVGGGGGGRLISDAFYLLYF